MLTLTKMALQYYARHLKDDPEVMVEKHLKHFTPVLGEVASASSRKLLIQALKSVGTKLELELIEGLNAFDHKWIDQPDFQRRHDTFKDIQKAIETQDVDLDLGVLLIHNCYYLLKSEKDLSLRENSSHCLRQLTSYLIKQYPKQLDYLLSETVFDMIRKGMKNRNDDFRNECILILGHLARECSESHVVLRDLNRYTNKSDPEVDFFENITHLQLHRHARALLKFCTVTRDLTTSPNVRTLTQFVLPLASFYLCSEKYVGKNSVIDASIECIGTVCRILPWHQYESFLKFYLRKLKKNVDYQKQLVRVTVTILDAFHYDLSKAQVGSEAEHKTEDDNKESESPPENEQSVAVEEDDEKIDDLDEPVVSELEEEDDEEEQTTLKETKICDKVPILCKSTATRVTRSIQRVLLPQLHKALAELTHHDTSHKVNRKKTGFEREEENLLRVPMSLALVKLLQR
ncbi:hypothetical protein Zmor_008182 [Zophobas morio]|uniref:U3 small nucleolar RNA-associated protein 20 N-terminal domain-containing protein n=1 Tax=Zophobas morio TaxID=2755281 RepID=A0AA38MQJ7_9CUCU|nr:hypothetical protein Zmor_008182 [Zophobas morio]